MTGSIRRRLLGGTAIAVSLAFLASGVLVHVLARSSLHTQLDEALVAKARALAALVEQEGDALDSELGEVPELPGQAEVHALWDAHGRVVSRSAVPGGAELEPATAVGGREVIVSDARLPDGRAARQVTLRFQPRATVEELAGRPRQTAVLVLARSTGEVDDAVGRISRVLIGVGVGGTLACVLVLAWIVRFGLAPVRALAAAIAAIREDDLGARIGAARTPSELRPIADRLNELLDRLSVAFARERELTAEVAHELRTPLAGLRATIEVALDRERPADRYRGALVDCLAICRDTERVVEALLSLARLDAGRVAPRSEPVALDDLVRELLAPRTALAAERGLAVTTELPPVALTSDPDQLRVIVGNLLDNALSYANPGGSLRVELSAAALRISNTGCELTPAQLAHVFERFWRGDAARAAGTHAGLGLALCKKLAALLGATLTAEVRDGTFVATLGFA